MKNKITKIYIMIFLFILTILFLSPISGDDWGNYIEGSLGLHHMIGQAIGMYFSWEGRFISRLLINLLTYNKWLWNIVNSIVITSIIYYINKIAKFKNKTPMILLVFLSIIFMNIFTFSQVITWIAGNITYLFVIPLLLIYIEIIYNNKDNNRLTNILLIILNIIIPMYIEHMAILLILLNFYFIIRNYYKHKIINKKLVSFLIISIISFITMYFSPGNQIRSGMENLEFNKLTIFGKIIYNMPNLIFYTYRINYFLIIILVIGNYYLIKKTIKRKETKIVLYIFELLSLIPAVTYLLENFNIINTIYINEHNIFIIIYYIIITILNFVLLVKNYKKTNNQLSLIFYSMGIMSNTIMLMSPTWGYRTSFATYLFLICCYLIVIDQNIKEKKYQNILLTVFAIIGMTFYLVFYINIYRVNQYNKKTILDAKKNKQQDIELIAYPSFAPCNINPTNEYHLKKFKEYYHLNKNVNIKIINKNWNYIIFYQK